MQKYILSNNFLTEELCDLFNEHSGHSESDTSRNFIYLDSNIEELRELDPGSEILVPLFYERSLDDNYFLDSGNVNEAFISKADKLNLNIFYLVFSGNSKISFKHLKGFEIKNYLTDENFYTLINESFLDQKSFLEQFSNKYINSSQMNIFLEFFSSLNSNGHERPNQFYVMNQKLDQITQEIITIRSLPFFFRTHSIIFRLLSPLNSLKNKARNLLSRKKRELNISSLSGAQPHLNRLKPSLDLARIKIKPNSIKLEKSEAPMLSIIIPVYGKVDYLARALFSIQRAKTNLSYEVIVVDDCGPEKVSDFFKNVDPGIQFLENNHNIGFTGTCNHGAKKAVGKYLCFLNSDTIVTDFWSDKLVKNLQENKTIGIVGPRLIYEDGILQESGGNVFSGGFAENIGKGALINESDYRYFREVDYVSGAALFISKSDFDELNGFDKTFSPAYYEDTSLCLDMRYKLKKKVFVNPTSTVIHSEGITNGVNVNSGVKKYQLINQKKFVKKHSKELRGFSNINSKLSKIKDKYVKGNVLIIDQCIPTPNMDSGSKDMDNLLKAIIDIGLRPHFFALSNRGELDEHKQFIPEIEEYFESGVNCVFRNKNNTFEKYFKEKKDLFDLIIVSRVTSTEEVLPYIIQHGLEDKTLFYTVDLHHLRMESEYGVTGDDAVLDQASKYKDLEFEAISVAADTVVLSNDEKKYLCNNNSFEENKIHVWPLIRSEFERMGSFEKNDNPKDIIFIGGFKHGPNIEAIKILEKRLLPHARDYFLKNGVKLPKIKIYGSNPTDYIKTLDNELITYEGFIENESDAFKSARISLAPLPFGAGLKGKVLSSFIYRTHVIGTKFAFEGFNRLDDRYFSCSSLKEEEFSKSLFEIYTKKSLSTTSDDWEKFISGLEKDFSYKSFRKTFKDYLSLKGIDV